MPVAGEAAIGRRIAPAVLKEDSLFASFESGFEFVQQNGSKVRMQLLLLHLPFGVDELHRRQLQATEALRHTN